mmetsp:Transcript_26239/g.52295  ORF Transcript_26239/g.52295 Transcript_26239/m.52295 type:complete len:160 (-) Transcript_26239:164-643(-)
MTVKIVSGSRNSSPQLHRLSYNPATVKPFYGHRKNEDFTCDTQSAIESLQLTNTERLYHNIPPLHESHDLSCRAMEHALWMAKHCSLRPSSELVMCLSQYSRRIGQNVSFGLSASDVHSELMELAGDASRILDSGFSSVGTGCARGPDGNLYICQFFRG